MKSTIRPLRRHLALVVATAPFLTVEDTKAYDAALDLGEPLKSMATTGGMEVRTMAIAAVQRIGVDATDVQIKTKAMVLAQTAAADRQWENEARALATDAGAAIRATMK